MNDTGRFLGGWGAVLAVVTALLVADVAFVPLGESVVTVVSANPGLAISISVALVLIQLAIVVVSLANDRKSRAAMGALRSGDGDWRVLFGVSLDILSTIAVIAIYAFASSEPLIRLAYSAQMELWGFWAFGTAIAVAAFAWLRQRRSHSDTMPS